MGKFGKLFEPLAKLFRKGGDDVAEKAAKEAAEKAAKEAQEKAAKEAAEKAAKEAQEKAAKEAAEKAAKEGRPSFDTPGFDDRKLTEYALNPDHPVGGHKARVFESATGLGKADAAEVKRQILEQVNADNAIKGKADQYGQRWSVDVVVTGPKGPMNVRTGWIVDAKTGETRLTTLVPGKK